MRPVRVMAARNRGDSVDERNRLRLREPLSDTTLVGLWEVASLLGQRVATVSMWRSRGILPTPTEALHAGPVWRWIDIQRWLATEGRRAGTPPRDRFPVFYAALMDWADALAHLRTTWRWTRGQGLEVVASSEGPPGAYAAAQALARIFEGPRAYSPGFWFRFVAMVDSLEQAQIIRTGLWESPGGRRPLPPCPDGPVEHDLAASLRRREPVG